MCLECALRPTVVHLVGGFTDPPRRRPDLGKRRFDARIGHVLGMIKHFGEPGGLFVPKPSPCLATLGLDAPGRGDDPWMATLPYGLPSISSYVKMGHMKRLSRVTPATLDVLAVLVWSPEELHGFALAKAAGRPTGSVYLILNRLEEAGMVGSYWEPVNAQNEGRPRRRFYQL